MSTRRSLSFAVVAGAGVLVSCTSDRPTEVASPATHPAFQSFAQSEWSEPVHLPAPVSSASRELGPRLSPDGLSLYFNSDRPCSCAFGAFDMWVSRRASEDEPWGEPANLGANINSAGGDGGATFSPDGHTMFFSSARLPSAGGEDIWVTHRMDTNDDLAWEAPVNLGTDVNTAALENGPTFIPQGDGGGLLYFSSAGVIHEVRVSHDGTPLEAAHAVAELNLPGVQSLEATIRRDGKEIIFWSPANRPGGLGNSDFWVATRQNTNALWSAPVNLGGPVNTTATELSPGLSADGRTLVFAGGANRGTSLGFQDIWMSTRTPSGH